jgi:competence protein CoiA
MRFAHVDGERREAEPGLAGTCPGCVGVVVAHCGEIKVRHWQHKSSRHCDHWWENETQWHRDWKNQFPEDWQEIVQYAEDGERHIADVKTADGWVLEFQHSSLKPVERQSRNAFYSPKLVWVVDALRRKTDLTQFEEMMSRASWVGGPGSFWTAPSHNCRLVREWSGSDAQILFDFGPNRALFWMVGQLSNGKILFANYTHWIHRRCPEGHRPRYACEESRHASRDVRRIHSTSFEGPVPLSAPSPHQANQSTSTFLSWGCLPAQRPSMGVVFNP